MTERVVLGSLDVLKDVRTFVSRAQALGCEHIRLSMRGRAMALSVGIMWRESLLESTPTVIGMRVAEIEPATGDVVVGLVALRDRVAREDVAITLPPPEVGVIWSGIAPPLDGWDETGFVNPGDLDATAQSGIAEIAPATGMGAHAVTELRRTVWSRRVAFVDQLTNEPHELPAAVALAAYGLGFIDSASPMKLTTSGLWSRLSNARGHVLVRSSG